MRLINFVTAVLIHAVLIVNTVAATPAATSKIIVIVNKDPISLSDLDDRIKLITLMSGLSAKKQDMENMRGQILKSIIQEKIQIQAAKNKKIEILDAEVDQTLHAMAKDNNMSTDQFLKILSDNKIPKQTLVARVRAQLAWVKYIRQQFAPLAHVTDGEVDSELKKKNAIKNQTQYLISEIMLMVNSAGQESTVRNDANKLIEDLRAGANFGMMAQQLSNAANGSANGDLGWVSLDQIDPAVATEVKNLKPEIANGISKPIRTPAGFKIIKLRGIRQPGEADPNEAEISFCQAFFPLTPTSTQEEIMAVAPQVEQTLLVTGCESFKKKVKENKAEYKHNIDIKMGQLPDQLRVILKTAPLGKCLEPIMTEQGLLLQMVCERKQAKVVAVNREEIRADLEQQKMANQAKRELQRLLSGTPMDYKDPKYDPGTR